MKKSALIPLILLLSIFSFSCKNGDALTKTATEKKEFQAELIQTMEKVTDWQISNFTYKEEGNLHDYGVDAWTNGVLYIGMSEFAKIADKSETYYDWLYKLGSNNEWKIPANFKDYEKYSLYHADELCVAQFYINMYRKYKEENIIKSTKERLDWIMSNPPGDEMSHKGKQSWTWCDALFMAPPVYANIAALEGNQAYLDYMNKEFEKTYNHLYNPTEKLFFRDDSFFDKKEANGKKIFWGRGNGWVIAGIANLLKVLSDSSPKKKFYVELYQTMMDRLVELRNADGFWHASLLDPESYPSPETSATAMITYAMAYGVNNGYLNKEKYAPIIYSSWASLVSVVNEEGRLGYVQPIGADPKKVTEKMTAVYGVGAFLLAGTEIYNMQEK